VQPPRVHVEVQQPRTGRHKIATGASLKFIHIFAIV
jgi:hypothetical protein